MQDLTDQLAQLHDDRPGAVSDAVIAADLNRGRSALRNRRRRVGAGIAVAAIGIGTATSLAYTASGTSSRGTPRADHTVIGTVPPSHTATAGHTATPARTGTPAIRLVAYRGRNLPGYTVERIPQGYVLQGISGSVLDVAEAGDHSPLDVFTGKITVTVSDYAGPTDGQHVTVDGHPGNIADDDGTLILTYNDGSHDVNVQSWSTIHITREQLVQFAEGVTVLPDVAVSHG